MLHFRHRHVFRTHHHRNVALNASEDRRRVQSSCSAIELCLHYGRLQALPDLVTGHWRTEARSVPGRVQSSFMADSKLETIYEVVQDWRTKLKARLLTGFHSRNPICR